jgi:hypothetical protein
MYPHLATLRTILVIRVYKYYYSYLKTPGGARGKIAGVKWGINYEEEDTKELKPSRSAPFPLIFRPAIKSVQTSP